MLPYINIFGKSIASYGVMAALAILAGFAYLYLSKPRGKVLEADIELCYIWCLVGTYIGAKVLYLLTVLPSFISDIPLVVENFPYFFQTYVTGGFVFYGGLIGIVAAALLYSRHSKLSLSELLSRAFPLVPLIHGIGRVGCFLTGCCYGRQSSIFGIAFTHSEIAPNGVPLVPVQLIEAVAELLLFLLLDRMRHKEHSGYSMLGVYLVCYGVLRFVLEFFRADDYRGFLFGLSTSQLISIIGVTAGIVLLALRAKRKKTPEEE